MRLPVPIAYVDGRRQIVVIGRDGQARLQTGTQGLLWANWNHADSDVHSWPTWSPDGARLAAFRIARSGQQSRVWVNHLGDVHAAEVSMMGGRVPIYIQWSVEGDRLAVLSQDSHELVLQVADPSGETEDAELLRGSPLFFTWVPNRRIAAFVGEGEPSKPRMAIVGSRGRHDLVGAPGNFCAPVRTALGLAYVAHIRGHVAVLVSSLDGSHVREVETVDGLVAIMASPDGQRLARAISRDGSGTPYEALELLDPRTALSTPVTDRPCVAFFWLPGGDGFVMAESEGGGKLVHWFRVGLDGVEEHLMDLIPSRDSRVYLRFFEQYAPSHPIVSPTGDAVLLCGTPPSDPEGASRVFWVPLDGSPAEELGEGLFANFAPISTPPEF